MKKKTNKKKSYPTWLKPLLIAVGSAIVVIGIVIGVICLSSGSDQGEGLNLSINGETQLPDDNFDD